MRHHVPVLWVVAGCLFEVSLPPGARWAGGTTAVTLLAEERRGADLHFRFRAETAGEATLLFADPEATFTVHLAPEHLAPERRA